MPLKGRAAPVVLPFLYFLLFVTVTERQFATQVLIYYWLCNLTNGIFIVS